MAEFTINSLASSQAKDTDKFIKSDENGVLTNVKYADIKKDVNAIVDNATATKTFDITPVDNVNIIYSSCKIKGNLLSITVTFVLTDGFVKQVPDGTTDANNRKWSNIFKMNYDGADISPEAHMVGVVNNDENIFLHFFINKKTVSMWFPEQMIGKMCALSFTTIL